MRWILVPHVALLATAGYDGRTQIWDLIEYRHLREIADPAVKAEQRFTSG